MKEVICVATLLAFTTYLAGPFTYASTEDCQVRPDSGVLLEQVRAKEKAVAVTLEVVSSKNCSWCKKMKRETIPTLRSAGYKVTEVPRRLDKRGSTRFPTLYYLDAKGKVVLRHVGFQTTKEVLKNLRKP